MSHVLVLRTPSASDSGDGEGGSGADDSYEAQLAPMTATSVPVYETVHTLDELQWILETGPGFHGYKGVVVTSKRAVTAWAAAARNVPEPADERAHWAHVPFYVVGAATASSVRELSTTLASAPHLAPSTVLGGEEAGTAEQLAHFILQRLADDRSDIASAKTGDDASRSSLASSTLDGFASVDNLNSFDSSKTRRTRVQRLPTKLLFLVGDKTRDVLPKILATDSTVELDSVQVYAAKPALGFAASLEAAVRAQPKVKTWWIALFAPSGADHALPFLREHFTLPGDTQQQKKKTKKGLPVAKIAAIGPTTAGHLRDVLKLEVAAVAAKPVPEELAAAIKSVK
ncbi:hypothetical protein M0805_008067 [Coniferiporia weirii]|nr:hypothetical protein M0805_008067 [Coniferiporia weirii]